MNRASPEQIRRFVLAETRAIEADLRAMEKARKQVQWLMGRDSNCSSAASLIDACNVLLEAAMEYHRRDRTLVLRHMPRRRKNNGSIHNSEI